MNRFETARTIVVHALVLVRQQKALLLFPLLHVAATIGIVAFFVLPLTLHVSVVDIWHFFSGVSTAPHARIGDPAALRGVIPDPRPTFLFLSLAAVYLISVFLATFINVAFYGEILNALNGKGASISRGLGLAATKIRSIVAWSLLVGTVGIVFKAIEDKLGYVGQWIAGLLGISWSVASVFVIPVMIRETRQAGPIEYLRISAKLIRRSWGEGVIGFAGITLVRLVVIALAVFVISRIVFWIGSLQAAVVGVLLLAGVIYLFTIAMQVFRCSLYIYATEGIAPGTLDENFLNRSWTVKSGSRR